MARRFAMLCFSVVLAACGSGGATSAAVSPSASAAPTASAISTPVVNLTAADRAQIAQLEERPLKVPAPASNGVCAEGPFTSSIVPYMNGSSESDVYGKGPVYGVGSSPITSGGYSYYKVTYISDPTVKGIVLVRIEDLTRRYQGRFVGPYAFGRSLGTDMIDGQQLPVFPELVLNAASPPPNTPATLPGWGVWHVEQGIDHRFGCAAIQIDTAAGTEVILGA